jgi:hypothetical protein
VYAENCCDAGYEVRCAAIAVARRVVWRSRVRIGAVLEGILGDADLWYEALNWRGIWCGIERCTDVRSEGAFVKSVCDIVGGDALRVGETARMSLRFAGVNDVMREWQCKKLRRHSSTQGKEQTRRESFVAGIAERTLTTPLF